MLYIGIDCGRYGGIGMINQKTNKVIGFEYSRRKLLSLCRMLNKKDKEEYRVFIENAHNSVRGLRNPQSVFNQGYNTGEVVGMFLGSGIKYKEVDPKVWQKEIGVIGAPKEATAEVVANRFECEHLLYTKRGRLIDGISDALGIALYGIIKDGGWE